MQMKKKVHSFINMVNIQQTSITETVQSNMKEKQNRRQKRRMKLVYYQLSSISVRVRGRASAY